MDDWWGMAPKRTKITHFTDGCWYRTRKSIGIRIEDSKEFKITKLRRQWTFLSIHSVESWFRAV